MSNRTKKTDLVTVRRSRAGFAGNVTKALDKLINMKSEAPEEIQELNTREVERLMGSMTRSETGFLITLEDAQHFLPTDEGEEAFTIEEDLAMDNFQDTISAARDAGSRLLALSSVLNGLSDFRNESNIIQESLDNFPDCNQSVPLQDLKNLLIKLREEWKGANIPSTHSLKAELDACRKTINNLEIAVAAVKDRSDLATLTSSTPTSFTSTADRVCYNPLADLPTIKVPTFAGDILEWSTFWAAFRSSIDSRTELNNTQKLQYLRQAVKDPDLQSLLHSPLETEDMYVSVIAELKDRFNKTREIHAHLTDAVIKLPTPKQTRVDLRRAVDSFKRTIDSLKQTEHYTLDAFLSSRFYLALPQRLQTLWDQHTKKDKGVPPILNLLKFIKEHAETLPSVINTPSDKPSDNSQKKNPRKSDQKPSYQNQKGRGAVHSVSPATPTYSYKWDCTLCKPEKHPLHACPKWAGYNITQRLAHIASKGLCSNCLNGGHATSTCKSTYRCRECGQPHHSTIHQQTSNVLPVNSSSIISHQVPDALMTTAQVLLIGPGGQEIKARALIDSGAGLSLVSQRITQLLDLPLQPSTLQFSAVQGAPCKPSNFLTSLIISPLLDKGTRITCRPAVVQTVTCDLPTQSVLPVTDLPHLLGLQLADTSYNTPGRIDILLGADLAPQIMVRQLLRSGTPSEPIAQATTFGWVISGPGTSIKHTTSIICSHHFQQVAESDEPQLDQLIVNFWDAENEETPELPLSVLETQVQQNYLATVAYLAKDKRYQVTLPKKPDAKKLGLSRDQAVSRFLSNERSVRRRGIYKSFQEVIQAYLDLQHAEPVPLSNQLPPLHYYLPMHAVFKHSSTTTKIRVVFDGSATTTSGTSLNQTLLVGPSLQPTLSNLLIKFRTYPVALNADISKMYREILLTPEDKDLHRFVWRATPDEPIKDYRMTRVTFGVSASPYLAIRTLQQTADDHGEGYPNVTHHIKNSFYVDDFLGGANTVAEAISLYDNIRPILLQGGFNLCKWRSSSPAVLQYIPTELHEKCLVKDATSPQAQTQSKALGLEWDSQKDDMSPSLCVSESYTPTKRGIISDVAKTYDILGWISPAILTMKLLYQALWKQGHEWDQTVTSEVASSHSSWRNDLPHLSKKRLSRPYSPPDIPIHSQQLHGFADASKIAYGAVVYVRTTFATHPPVVSLVTAKTKVAKLKAPSIPKMELDGAILLTKIMQNVAPILGIAKEDCHYWSDSSIVLAWLDGNSRNIGVYEDNRIHFIMERTLPELWRHVPSTENPADCASRGMMPEELLNHTLWWEGPPWLSLEPLIVPHQPPRKIDTAPINFVVPASNLVANLNLLSSNYYYTLATTAWVLRFYTRIKLGPPTPLLRPKHLTGEDIHQAEIWLLRESQLRTFFNERKALEAEQTRLKSYRAAKAAHPEKEFPPEEEDKICIPANSRILSLTPFLDKDHLLRVEGRLRNSSLSPSQQHPIIGDGKDPLIIKMFASKHLSLLHCGPSLLLCSISSKFHIVGARRLSRTICSQCVTCRRISPRPDHQMMADLPAPRVNPTIAFTHTGMDFCGPFTIKMGHVRRPTYLKASICIFVCMTFKAVHLEVVSDESTEAFLACFRRFAARRNCPTHLYSDNGSNFMGAKNQLLRIEKLLQEEDANSEVRHYLSQYHSVTWHANPPAAPHFGGLWESAVKSAKRHLRRIMGELKFTFEELTTTACQIEACLNSRPLLPLTSHSQDGLMTLTASHFLLFKTPQAVPEDPRLPREPHLLTSWNKCQSIIHHFWRRWSKEYLGTLQQRTKWQRTKPNLQPEDIVILKSDKVFSCHWPLARIIAVHPGQDGRVRVATIRTATGVYKRPTAKLALLHRPSDSEDSSKEPSLPLPPGGCLGRNQLSQQQPEVDTADPVDQTATSLPTPAAMLQPANLQPANLQPAALQQPAAQRPAALQPS